MGFNVVVTKLWSSGPEGCGKLDVSMRDRASVDGSWMKKAIHLGLRGGGTEREDG